MAGLLGKMGGGGYVCLGGIGQQRTPVAGFIRLQYGDARV
jgi:hypothetical protein